MGKENSLKSSTANRLSSPTKKSLSQGPSSQPALSINSLISKLKPAHINIIVLKCFLFLIIIITLSSITLAAANVSQVHYRWRDDNGFEGNNFLSYLYGLSSYEYFRSIYIDDDYVYVAGYTGSEGNGSADGLILKVNKTDLEVIEKKTYGGNGSDYFYGIDGDANYIYAVGYTNSQGKIGTTDALIVKFNKTNLDVIAHYNIGGGTSTSRFDSVYVHPEYVFATGRTNMPPAYNYDFLLVSFNNTNFNIEKNRTYGRIGNEYGYSIHGFSDYNYTYVAGQDPSGLSGLIYKIEKGLSWDYSQRNYSAYGLSSTYYSVLCDSDYVYAAGYTSSSSMEQGMIVKYNRSSLNVVANKTIGGTRKDYFYGLSSDSDYVYVVGYTNSSGTARGYDWLILRLNKTNLNITSGKFFGGIGNDYLYDLEIDDQYIYAVGGILSPDSGNADAAILKIDKSLPTGSFNSTPEGLIYNDIELDQISVGAWGEASTSGRSTSNLSLSTSGFVLGNSSLTSSDYYCEDASWKQSEDSAHTNQAINEDIRLRLSIKNSDSVASDYKFQLQSAPKGASSTCEDVVSGSYSDVPTNTAGCGSSIACMYTSNYFSDGDSTTRQLTSEGTFIPGRMVEDPSNKTNNISIDQDFFTEIEVNFRLTSNAAGSTPYCFRVTNSGAFLDSYVKVAEIITSGTEMNPAIYFVPPTDNNSETITRSWSLVNVTVNSTYNTSAFIDWNRSLVGWWNFESYNETGIYDNSTYNNFGTFTGGLSTSDITTGKYGNAIDFDGVDDYINTSFNIPNETGSRTITAWVKISDKFDNDTARVIIKNTLFTGDSTDSGISWVYRSDQILFYVINGSGYRCTPTTLDNPDKERWYHITLVHDNSNVYSYVDGILSSTITCAGSKKNTNGLKFGTREPGSSNFFNGSIDEVLIFSRALSPEEINASYNAGTYRLYNNFTGLANGNYNFTAYAIDELGYINMTEERSITVGTTSSCLCPGAASNWIINMSHSCNITEDCDITTGYLNFTSTGYARFNATINMTGMQRPAAGQTVYIERNAYLIVN